MSTEEKMNLLNHWWYHLIEGSVQVADAFIALLSQNRDENDATSVIRPYRQQLVIVNKSAHEDVCYSQQQVWQQSGDNDAPTDEYCLQWLCYNCVPRLADR